ncbi:MAG TPA: hypothetical protein VIX17_02215 [Pyrinomonadaceae bacterium]|jgi:hypothetical protein
MPINTLTFSPFEARLRSVVQSHLDLFGLALLVLAIIIGRVIFGWQLQPGVQAFVNEHRYYLILTVVFGAIVGASEIMSRYRDEPFQAIFSPPGRVYMLLNGVISASAYLLLLKYRATVLPSLNKDNLMTSVVAGFGAMMFLRSKLFSFRTEGGEAFSVGPDAVLSTLLNSVNRRVDRFLSYIRQEIVYDEAVTIQKPEEAPNFLAMYLTAYQNIPDDEKKVLAEDIQAVLNRSDLNATLKLMAISFGFMNIGGYRNFRALMALLRKYESRPPR